MCAICQWHSPFLKYEKGRIWQPPLCRGSLGVHYVKYHIFGSKKYLSLFCPRPSQKTEPQVFVYFLLSNTHYMFQLYALVTWYLINDWQKRNRSHKLHTPLSLFLAISKEKWGPSPKVKTSTPQGCPLFLWPTFLIFRRPRAPPC